MRTESVTATSEKQALDQCPWAAVCIEVDSGLDSTRLWKCWESTNDYDVWQGQS